LTTSCGTSSVREVAGRYRFHRDLVDLPAAAESFGRERKVRLREVAAKMAGVKAEATVVGASWPDEAVLRERRRRDPGHPRPAWVHALGPGAVLEKLQAAARHRQHDALRHGGALRIETKKLRRGKCAAERADQSGRMEADLMEAALGDRPQPSGNFHCRHVGRQQGFTIPIVPVGQRQGTREAARGRMNDAARMGVVEVKAVDEYPVHEYGVTKGQAAADADNG
jgi:hypothetical protein